MYAKVSKKGRITIPKAIRKQLDIDDHSAVLFIVEDNEVKLKVVPAATAESLAGSLKEYAAQYTPLDEIRKKIQKDIARKAAEGGNR